MDVRWYKIDFQQDLVQNLFRSVSVQVLFKKKKKMFLKDKIS